MSSLKILKSFRIPTNAHSFLLPFAQSRVLYLRKRSRSPWLRQPLDSQNHQLCCRCDLQLIQNHVAPSHGPPARNLSPLFFQAKSLLLPKPCGKNGSPLKLHSPNFCQRCMVPKAPAWLPRLGLNPSASLLLQPHFLLLLQSVTPASIPVFFQLY